MIPYTPPEKYMFTGCTINGVYVRPVASFSSDEIWYDDLISRCVPEMGEKYTSLLIKCSGHAYIFLDIAQTIDNENTA